MSNKELEHFDLENVYDDEIDPLMKKIIKICKKHKLPTVCDFNYRNSEEGSEGSDHCTTLLAFKNRTSKEINRIINVIDDVRKPAVIAETIETLPDGSKKITINKV
jgi:hypothetical protein